MSELGKISSSSNRQEILSSLESDLAQFHETSSGSDLKSKQTEILGSEIVTNPFLKQYILLGYAAKGVVYFLIGTLAIEAAILPERKAVGTYKALKYLSGQPLGGILLCLLAFCLGGYVLRRFLQAVVYPGHSDNSSWTQTFQRTGYLISSISYAGVAYSALSIVFELGKYSDTINHAVKKLFLHPTGECVVFVGGIGVVGVGIGYLYGAYSGSYISKFDSFNIDSRLRYFARLMGKLGIASRGIAFVVTGVCLMVASIVSDANLAGGLQNAFQVLAEQPFGWLWLGAIGSGFIAYSLYMLATARYRKYAIR